MGEDDEFDRDAPTVVASEALAAAAGGLTDRQRAILDHEGLTWRRPGAKEASILERFDVTATRYYAELHALLALPEALRYAPVTVRRLQRLTEARREARTAQRP